jgi:hypothetical protein
MWTPFSQVEWCKHYEGDDSAGVCRALVVLWLMNKGIQPPAMTAENIEAVRSLMSSDNIAKDAKGLMWRGAKEDGKPKPKFIPLTVDDLESLKRGPLLTPGSYMIGMHSGEGARQARGHAVGALVSGLYAFFDPNRGSGIWPPSEAAEYNSRIEQSLIPLGLDYLKLGGKPQFMLYEFVQPSVESVVAGLTALTSSAAAAAASSTRAAP